MPSIFHFDIRFEAQCWWVKCAQAPGLFATGSTIPEALENAAKGLRDLALAFATEAAAGNAPKPIFRD